jgi:lipopolysaccharide transport system ATP-binding protein
VSEPSIELRNVARTYDAASSGGAAVLALRDISLSVSNGERVGIIGDNGAGKSTLLQIIAGVNSPTSGTVNIEGRVHAILTVGLGLREEATGRENLFLEGALLGKSREQVEAKLDEMIAFAELGEFIDQPVRTYSSGMKSRLSFASLTHIDPEILIIDEALSVGDSFFAAKASRMMQELCARGRIVLLVTHSVSAIKQMCQRCIWLEAGGIKADGPSEIVATAYASATRVRQEAEIARKFGDSGQTWSSGAGATLSSPRLVRRGDRVETAMIEAGAGAGLEVRLVLSQPMPKAVLDVRIESSDGLLLADEKLALDQAVLRPGTHDLFISLGPVDWRPFLYQAQLRLRDDSAVFATTSSTFKVYSDVAIFGGNPLLRTGLTLRVPSQTVS